MTKNEYRELMMDILAMTIKEYEDEGTDWMQEDYAMGIIHGLRIAHRKLKDSAFLTQEDEENE